VQRSIIKEQFSSEGDNAAEKKSLQLLFEITWTRDLMGELAAVCMEGGKQSS